MVGEDENKPRGRMTAYAFFVQTCREEHKKRHPDEQVLFQEFSKKCAERWKTMTDREKKWFNQMAEGDKRRYEAEISKYVAPADTPVKRGRKPKKVKDPNAPKRALSGFFWFSNDERGKVRAANPDFGVGDIAKELGRRWSECPEDIKAKFEALAANDRQRYDKEKVAYQLKLKGVAEVPLDIEDDD